MKNKKTGKYGNCFKTKCSVKCEMNGGPKILNIMMIKIYKIAHESNETVTKCAYIKDH